MEEIENIKINIRLLRTKAGLSRNQLAKRANVSGYTIVDIEHRNPKDIKLTTLLKIAKGLNAKIEKLLKKPPHVDEPIKA